MSELLTAKEIADQLKLAPRYVAERLSKTDGFPTPYKFGSSRRWNADEFEEWMKSRKN